MEIPREQVCILIPTLNEEPTIGSLIRDFRQRGYPCIFVMDGHSTDRTRKIAEEEGAMVHIQTNRGKGNAIIEAISSIETPYVLMIDGDGTYSADDADQMVRPLLTGYDHVIGLRKGERSFSRMNQIGNHLINTLFKLAHGRYLADILSGYRAFSLDSIRQMQLREEGFEIEAEMAVQAMKNTQQIAVVPVQYRTRKGTETKLNPIQDGFRIIRTIYRMAKLNNPLFYFGLIGVFLLILGGAVGIFVILEWLQGIERLPLTILTLLLVTLGFEIVMFGVMGDLILAFHREILVELQQIRKMPPP